MKTLLNFRALDHEMVYEPLWPEDRYILRSILNSHIITQKKLLDLARLYIRYQHRLSRYETRTAFKILLRKSGYSSFHELHGATKDVYIH